VSRRLLTASALLAAAVLLFRATHSPAQEPATPTRIAKSDLKALVANAHSSDQYRQLATYFHRQEQEYRTKAAAEKVERDRRAAVNAGLSQKYPRPVDSAEYLYESYVSSADRAAAQAQHYDRLASNSTM